MENFEDFQHIPDNTPEPQKNTQEDFTGWKTTSALSDELGVYYSKVKKIAHKYLASNPEFFKFEDKSKEKSLEYYSPELVGLIAKEAGAYLETKVPAPEGWKSKNALLNELESYEGLIENIAGPYRKSNPEYFKDYESKGGRVVEHFSPDLVRIIKEKKIENDVQDLPGWKTSPAIKKEFNLGGDTVRQMVDKYRKTNPQYFKYKQIKDGKKFEYYSPELYALIKEELEKNPLSPEGWATKTTLLLGLKTDAYKIKDIIDQYRESNPEYFKEFRSASGSGFYEYYSPELVDIISKEIQKTKEIPFASQGWKTNGLLAVELSAHNRSIKKIADRYRQTNPEYFKEMKVEAGPVREHYSPELIKVIKKEIDKFKNTPEAPSGWETFEAVVRQFGKSKMVSKTIEAQRQTNPERFREFKDKRGGIFEHFSPEVIKLLNQATEKIGNAPEGWLTQETLYRVNNISYSIIKEITDQYRLTNAEYFHTYKNKKNKTLEHFSPDLVKIILEKSKSYYDVASPLPGWKTKTGLSKEYDVGISTIDKLADEYRTTHAEHFKDFRTNIGLKSHLSPELAKEILGRLNKVETAPPGWKTSGTLQVGLTIDQRFIEKISDSYRKTNPEYFKKLKDIKNRTFEHFSPELVKIITDEVLRKREAKGKFGKYKDIPDAQEGWKTNKTLAKSLGVSQETTQKIANKYRETDQKYFKKMKKFGRVFEHYSPELVSLIQREVNKFLEIPKASDGFQDWMTDNALQQKLGVLKRTTFKIANEYRESNPEYFRLLKSDQGPVTEHYSPALIEIIAKRIDKINEYPKVTDPLYEEWRTNFKLSEELKISPYYISQVANPYKKSNPEFFKEINNKGKLYEHYSPELVAIIKNDLVNILEQQDRQNNEQVLRASLENFVQEIADTETNNEQAKKIGEIIRLLPGNAHDILLRYHPEYKGMPVGYVKKIIADYLGDFMLARRDWRAEDVEKFREVMDIKNIKEAILFNLKNACLGYVNLERKKNSNADERILVEEYFNKKEMTTLAESSIPEVASAITELHEYYRDIFKLKEKKPDNIVDTLKAGRVFPDINQLLNIKEMKEKKKMLIADEMGLGKSASAILTKEYLGLKCALVIVPSNVTDTWDNYLSDKVGENGKQLGYFKKGLVPKTLVIESPKDLGRLEKEVFDYIIISQEKMAGAKYGDALEKVNFDMMIVDEVHKLKNIESGVRSDTVMRLAEKIQGEDAYLALLSGTPIPNKVKDIAVCLKLLYPEKYRDFDNKEMVNRILYGDLIDLRTELLMRTQMKELATSIEMPKLTEIDVYVDLSPEEREIYEILLEEDELTASEKIILFRQFLLNPALLSVEPGFMGSKVKKLEETLIEDLKTQDKIIVFVNGYVEGVIRGEKNIIKKMNLPAEVIIEEIHGEVGSEERKRIQAELKSKNQKTIVFVSGQTADVGVDFSGADGAIFYNEPWSKYDKNQQRGRVYREGLKHALISKTLVTRNSIEEGIRRYILAKEKAVEKLLRGISNTEAEKKLLYNDSKLAKDDVETNSELSQEYQSDWEKLMLHFGQGFESGEKRFKQDLDKKGKEYADLYRKLGRLTYQGNNARATATLFEKMIAEKNEPIEKLRVIDIASGPEMLKEASDEKLRNRIFSMDINAEHFTESDEKRKTLISSYLNLPSKDKSVDYCNLGFAYHQTSPIKYHKKNYERLQVLAEMNRVLKPGGRAVISMLHNVKFVNEEKLRELVEELGFKIVPEYSGRADGGKNYKAQFYTLEKIEDIPGYSKDTAQDITRLGERLGRELLEGLEMKKVRDDESRLKDQRRMVNTIVIGGKEIPIMFNKKDKELYTEEVQSLEDGEALKLKYGGITNIPIEEIKAIGFERKLETPGYYLLYKVIKGGGAVIVRGDFKNRISR